jgi:hypothetical protein
MMDGCEVLALFDGALAQLEASGMSGEVRSRVWAALLAGYIADGLPYGPHDDGFGRWLRDRVEDAEAVRTVERLLGYKR